MKIKIFYLLFCVMGLSLSAQELTFRGYKFGVSIDEVVAKEGAPSDRYTSKDRDLLAGDEGLEYENVIVANHKAAMETEFKDKKLVCGGYNIILKDITLSLGATDPREVSQAYNDLLTKLTSLYGKPKIEKNIELLENNVSNMLAQEISQGAPYSATWEYYGGAVVMIASYNTSWSLGLLYVSPDVYDLIIKAHASSDGL